MKIKIKNFVFAGIAAAMFASIAHAEVSPALQEGDLTSNATTDKYVTAKSYVDRVVLNHKNNSDVHVSAADREAWNTAATNAADVSNKQNQTTGATDYQLGTAAHGWVDMTTAQQNALNSGVTESTVSQVTTNAGNIATNAANITNNSGLITTLQSTKQDKQDSTTTAGNYITAGTGVGANLGRLDTQVKVNADAIAANAGAISSLQTSAANIENKQDKSASAVSSTDAEDAATGGLLTAGQGVGANLVSVATQATTNANNITGLQNTKENLSNKVTQGFVSADANGNITSVADGNAANYASTGAISSDLKKVKAAIDLKQNTISDLSDIRSGAALGATALQSDAITNMEVTTNKKQTITNSESDYPSGAAVYSHTNNGDIHVTSTQKTNWQNATDAVNDASTGLATKLPTSTYNTQIGTVSSGNMGTNAGTVVGAINELSTAIGTLNTASGDYQLIANKATDVTAVLPADKDTKYPTVGAVQAPSSCNSSAPCAWINNAWVPIQQ